MTSRRQETAHEDMGSAGTSTKCNDMKRRIVTSKWEKAGNDILPSVLLTSFRDVTKMTSRRPQII